MGELGVRADTYNVFSLASLHGEIEVTGFCSVLLVQARVVHVRDVFVWWSPKRQVLSAAKTVSRKNKNRLRP